MDNQFVKVPTVIVLLELLAVLHDFSQVHRDPALVPL